MPNLPSSLPCFKSSGGLEHVAELPCNYGHATCYGCHSLCVGCFNHAQKTSSHASHELCFTQPMLCLYTCSNGVAEWYFPGSAHGGGDVIIQRTDITAGSAVIHLVDNYITSPSQSIFWTQQAKNVGCGEVSVDTRQTASPGMIAGRFQTCKLLG
jgi:hypothetical protein